MARGVPDRPTGEVPTSPTGRIPQWVLDEAAGRSTAAVPFRAPPDASRASRSRRRPRALRITAGLAVGAVAVAGAVWLSSDASVPVATGLPQDVARSEPEPRTWPPPGRDETPRPAGLTTVVTKESPTSGFRYSQHQADRVAPTTWSPCRAIHYVVRAAHAPAGGASMLRDAFSRLSAATGLTFVSDGATDEGPVEDRPAYQPDTYGDRWAPVLIAWATKAEVPDFGVDIIGEAGPVTMSTPGGASTYVTGVVFLDAATMSEAVRAGLSKQMEAVVLHELGHLVGLAHVDDPQQLMFPRAQTKVATYGAGDLAGLAALGRGACQPNV